MAASEAEPDFRLAAAQMAGNLCPQRSEAGAAAATAINHVTTVSTRMKRPRCPG
jgi:hypothetical protein